MSILREEFELIETKEVTDESSSPLSLKHLKGISSVDHSFKSLLSRFSVISKDTLQSFDPLM